MITSDFLNGAYFLSILAMLFVVFYIFLKHYANKEDKKYPFGRLLRDEDILVLSLDELRGFEPKYLLRMEAYAVDRQKNVSDELQKVKWKDLLRRIDIVLDEI